MSTILPRRLGMGPGGWTDDSGPDRRRPCGKARPYLGRRMASRGGDQICTLRACGSSPRVGPRSIFSELLILSSCFTCSEVKIGHSHSGLTHTFQKITVRYVAQSRVALRRQFTVFPLKALSPSIMTRSLLPSGLDGWFAAGCCTAFAMAAVTDFKPFTTVLEAALDQVLPEQGLDNLQNDRNGTRPKPGAVLSSVYGFRILETGGRVVENERWRRPATSRFEVKPRGAKMP